ncbi:DUF4129 domain-containing protein [Bacillus sp. KH172YL63]|uniref:DUF4129 domain-containing protein n=1 Tax=Bacillus sp. KH172YL63 TaxID=2709784 RepID=UPI00156368E8|nr:DUF4129 domain-containing protein [Bacillus sp. KH172YL63]
MLDENKARDHIEDILNGKEYRAYRERNDDLMTSLWEKAKEWIEGLLGKINPAFEPTGAASSSILIILIVIAVAVLLVFTFAAIRNGARRRKFRSNKPLQSLNEMNWSYSRHLEEALKQESLGDYSKATRHIFLALLLYFHEQSYLEAKAWKTNWEYYDELRKVNQGWADRFYELALLFDEVAYGEREVEATEYLHCKEEVLRWVDAGNDPAFNRVIERGGEH